ncbi:MAG: hypothetical protein ACI8RA_002120, partial [Chlamydiales bacterium]
GMSVSEYLKTDIPISGSFWPGTLDSFVFLYEIPLVFYTFRVVSIKMHETTPIYYTIHV